MEGKEDMKMNALQNNEPSDPQAQAAVKWQMLTSEQRKALLRASQDTYPYYGEMVNQGLVTGDYVITQKGLDVLAATPQPTTYSYPEALKTFFPNVDSSDFEQKIQVTETTATPQPEREGGKVAFKVNDTVYKLRAAQIERVPSGTKGKVTRVGHTENDKFVHVSFEGFGSYVMSPKNLSFTPPTTATQQTPATTATTRCANCGNMIAASESPLCADCAILKMAGDPEIQRELTAIRNEEAPATTAAEAGDDYALITDVLEAEFHYSCDLERDTNAEDYSTADPKIVAANAAWVRVQAELATLRDQLQAARDESERLREALKPFAAVFKTYQRDLNLSDNTAEMRFTDWLDATYRHSELIERFEKAAAALSPAAADGKRGER